MSTVVVKVGSSSVTTSAGAIDTELLQRLAREVVSLAHEGTTVIVVSSGAIAAGWAALAPGTPRPAEVAILQAVAAVGQPHLMSAWAAAFAPHHKMVGQVLLNPLDFIHRTQYLHARGTLDHLCALGVTPVVNENDATSDEEIRFGDNDRLAALVAQLVGAQSLVLLTDTEGLFTADPNKVQGASLIEEVTEFDQELLAAAGGPTSAVGSGGMASKLAAAKMATWSGIEVTIADAHREGVLADAVAGISGTGTVFRATERRLPARKLWLAFAVTPTGTIVIDDGAASALERDGRSLLCAGVRSIEGTFEVDDAVEVTTTSGRIVAKGLVRLPASSGDAWIGRRASELGDGLDSVVIHRDDLVTFR